MTLVAPRIVNSVSCVTRINHEIRFSWQAQYLVTLNCHFSWQAQHCEEIRKRLDSFEKRFVRD